MRVLGLGERARAAYNMATRLAAQPWYTMNVVQGMSRMARDILLSCRGRRQVEEGTGEEW
jgi:hypothetical protein